MFYSDVIQPRAQLLQHSGEKPESMFRLLHHSVLSSTDAPYRTADKLLKQHEGLKFVLLFEESSLVGDAVALKQKNRIKE